MAAACECLVTEILELAGNVRASLAVLPRCVFTMFWLQEAVILKCATVSAECVMRAIHNDSELARLMTNLWVSTYAF